MKLYFKSWFGVALLFAVSGGLCVPFLDNNFFFDDLNFFSSGGPADFLKEGFSLAPRWWVYETLAATYVHFGGDVYWLRLGNFLLHFCVSVVLMFFIRELLFDVDRLAISSVSVDVAALLAAFLFLIHPLSVFTQGYLIQRTIICATLFFLLSLWAFWRALSGSLLALFGFCFFAVLAMYAKEHAVMLPAAAFLMLVFRWRSGLSLGLSWRLLLGALFVVCIFSLSVVAHVAGFIGVSYEPQAGELLRGADVEYLYLRSVLNQAGLFFKYIFLWLGVLPSAVSVDIKQLFPSDLFGWRLWLGAIAYVCYFSGALLLLWRGGVLGLFGVGLLLPGVMFFTEFSSVRVQEPFVVYRSYLWAPFIFVCLAVAVRRVRLQVALLLVFLVGLVFFGLSVQRLKTFSSPLLIWYEAASVYEAELHDVDVLSGYRIYYNLGTQLKLVGASEGSLKAFNRALELKPGDGYVLNNRGSLYMQMKMYALAQRDYEGAVQLLPHKFESWNGLANSLKAQGKKTEADRAWNVSCSLREISPCPAF